MVQFHCRVSCSRILPWPVLVGSRTGACVLMADPKSADRKQPASDASFSDVTKEVARRNEEAQKLARKKRAAREKEQMAVRRSWERL